MVHGRERASHIQGLQRVHVKEDTAASTSEALCCFRGLLAYIPRRCWIGLKGRFRVDGKDQLAFHSDGGAYFGGLLSGEPSGFGVYLSASGVLYEGEWLNGWPHGFGRESNPDGGVFCGSFAQGIRQGDGISKSILRKTCSLFREAWRDGGLLSRERVMIETAMEANVAMEASGLNDSVCQYHKNWNADEIHQWLCQNGFARFCTSFENAKVVGETLQRLNHHVLETELHILRYGHRCELLTAVRSLLKGHGCFATSGSRGNAEKFALNLEHLQLSPQLAGVGQAESGSPCIFRGCYLGKEVAVCAIRNQGVDDFWKGVVDKLATLRHPGLVLYMGFIAPPPVQDCYLVSEYLAWSSLYDWLRHPSKSRRKWTLHTLPTLLRVSCGIASAMNYLHLQSVVYADFQPSKVLLNDKFVVKLTDYTAAVLDQHLGNSRTQMLHTCSPWSAPESCRFLTTSPAKPADVYAFGVILWELLSRQKPFEGFSPCQIAIAVGFAHCQLSCPGGPHLLRILVSRCTNHCTLQRPSFETISTVLQSQESGETMVEDALGAFFGD